MRSNNISIRRASYHKTRRWHARQHIIPSLYNRRNGIAHQQQYENNGGVAAK